MKTILFFSILALSSQAVASDFFSEMEKIYTRYDLCDVQDAEQIQADKTFSKMYHALKKADESNRPSSIEVMDFAVSYVTLRDQKKDFECTMHIDGYEGRCYYVECY